MDKLKPIIEEGLAKNVDVTSDTLKDEYKSKSEVAGFQIHAIYIPDDKERSGRIKLRKQLVDAFAAAGFKTEDVKMSSETIPILQVYDGNVGHKIRIFFKKIGGSAPVTEFGESIVCYALAIRQKLKREITILDMIEENVQQEYVHTFNKGAKISLTDCLKKLDDQWIQTGVNVANAFHRGEPTQTSDGVGRKMSISKCHFHRGDEFMGKIEDCFKTAIKGTKEGKLAGMNINKWNPADIWISRDYQSLQFTASKYETIGDLNRYLDELFGSGHLKGVSLKKTVTDKTTLQKVPTAVRLESPVTFLKFENHTFNKLTTMDIYVHFTLKSKKGRMQFRTFGGDSGTDHQGSIQKMEGQSEAAVHGKVGVYQAFLEDYIPTSFREMYREKQVKVLNKEWKDGGDKKYALASMMQTFYAKVDGSEPDIEKILNAKYSNFGSKYLSMQVAYLISIMNVLDQKKFLSDIITYAMSQIPDVSSVHIKNK